MTDSDDITNDKDEEGKIEPLEVTIKKEKEHPEWEDIIETNNYMPTEEEIKEMTDAQ